MCQKAATASRQARPALTGERSQARGARRSRRGPGSGAEHSAQSTRKHQRHGGDPLGDEVADAVLGRAQAAGAAERGADSRPSERSRHGEQRPRTATVATTAKPITSQAVASAVFGSKP